MESIFTIGDVVELVSGGPKMVVDEISGYLVTCKWFDKEDHAQWANFNQKCLEKVGNQTNNLDYIASAFH